MITKRLTFMANGDWNGQTNHKRRQENQRWVKSRLEGMKQHRNQRRNERKKLIG